MTLRGAGVPVDNSLPSQGGSGTGQDVAILELAQLVAEVTGFAG